MLARNRLVVVLAFAMTIVVIAATFARPLRCVYHRWRFDVANDHMLNGPSRIDAAGYAMIDFTEVEPVHEYHMGCLVELGAIARIAYTFTNILNNSPQRRSLSLALFGERCPAALYWSSPSPSGTSRATISVWCEIADEDRWNRFLDAENNKAKKRPEPSDAPKDRTLSIDNGSHIADPR